MFIKMTIVLDVEEQDTTKDGIEAFQNQIRSMDMEDVIEMADYKEELPLGAPAGGVGVQVGDEVGIMDLGGNVVVVGPSKVMGADEATGHDGSRHIKVRTEKGGIVWYSDEHYQLVPVRKGTF